MLSPEPVLTQIYFAICMYGVTRPQQLTHWGRVTHICIINLTIIGPDNGLSPGRRQAIIWTNAGILLIGPWGTNFSGILISIQTFSFKKMYLKMSSAKWRPFCLGLRVLTHWLTHGCVPMPCMQSESRSSLLLKWFGTSYVSDHYLNPCDAGLVLSGIKSLPEPILTNNLWCHIDMAWLGHNDLIVC